MYAHTIAIGKNTGAGLVTIYRYDAARHQWPQTQVIYPTNPVNWKDFGQAVALNGRWLFIGAPSLFSPGSVYIARRDTGVYTMKYELPKPPASVGNSFGVRLVADGNRLMVFDKYWDSYFITPKATFLYDLCAFPSIRGQEKDVFCQGDSIHYEAA